MDVVSTVAVLFGVQNKFARIFKVPMIRKLLLHEVKEYLKL